MHIRSKMKVKAPTKPAKYIRDAEIKIVPIDSVKLWKNNPRKNDAASERLKSILTKHGQVTAVVVWKKNMVAYKGNTTLKALKAIGAKEVRVMLVDFPDEHAAIAYGIADNRASEFSYWDDETLEVLMTEGKFDHDELGFTKKEFNSVTLIPDIEKINSMVEKPNLPINVITIRCDTDVLDEIKKDIKEYLEEYGNKAVVI